LAILSQKKTELECEIKNKLNELTKFQEEIKTLQEEIFREEQQQKENERKNSLIRSTLEQIQPEIRKSEERLQKWKELTNRKDFRSLTEEDICVLLIEYKLGNFCEIFRKHHISGDILKFLSEKDLSSTLGMSFLERKKFQFLCENIQDQGEIDFHTDGIANWPPEQVAMWIQSNFPAIENKFLEHHISGDVLLQLTEEDLEVEFGMEILGHRKKLIQKIADLKKERGDSIQHFRRNFRLIEMEKEREKKEKQEASKISPECEKNMEKMEKQELEKNMEKTGKVIPNALRCPITREILHDPVLATDGWVYERSAIEKWFETHNTSPMTNQKLLSFELRPCLTLKSLILNELSLL